MGGEGGTERQRSKHKTAWYQRSCLSGLFSPQLLILPLTNLVNDCLALGPICQGGQPPSLQPCSYFGTLSVHCNLKWKVSVVSAHLSC